LWLLDGVPFASYLLDELLTVEATFAQPDNKPMSEIMNVYLSSFISDPLVEIFNVLR